MLHLLYTSRPVRHLMQADIQSRSKLAFGEPVLFIGALDSKISISSISFCAVAAYKGFDSVQRGQLNQAARKSQRWYYW
jgi:hypothetical protein